jgi:hypothetical protein
MIGFIALIHSTHTYNTALLLISSLYNSLLHLLVSKVYFSLHYPLPGNRFQYRNYSNLTVTSAHMKSSLHSLITFLPLSFYYHSMIHSGYNHWIRKLSADYINLYKIIFTYVKSSFTAVSKGSLNSRFAGLGS